MCLSGAIYAFVSPFSLVGAATHLRKIAVPVAAGMILDYAGCQGPFCIGFGFVLVTLRLDPVRQRSEACVALDRVGSSARVADGVRAEAEPV